MNPSLQRGEVEKNPKASQLDFLFCVTTLYSIVSAVSVA